MYITSYEEYYIISDGDEIIRNEDRVFLVLRYKDDDFIIKELRAESLGFTISNINPDVNSDYFNKFTSEVNPFKWKTIFNKRRVNMKNIVAIEGIDRVGKTT